jgi:alpha-tubulin suppressor-like RCC1 family protein
MLFACGGNAHGQLGTGHKQNEQGSMDVLPPLSGGTAKMISCGGNHTILLSEDGFMFGCGKNEFGQLGLGHKTADKTLFQPIPPLPGGMVVRQIVCGDIHTVILTEDGSIFSCGNNSWGQLGLDNDENQTSFQTVPPLPEGKVAKQISCGSAHTMVLAWDGSVFGCGFNESGELGLGHANHQPSLQLLKPLPTSQTVRSVVCGGVVDSAYTMLLCEDGTTFGCGANDDGQLGLGHIDSIEAFEVLPPLSNRKVAKQIICGASHSIILTQDGSIFGAGNNASGQLGLGHTEDQASFRAMKPLPSGKTPKLIECGGHHTLCLTEDGSVYGCGFNLNGALGLGHLRNLSSMEPIPFYTEHTGYLPCSGPSSSHTVAMPIPSAASLDLVSSLVSRDLAAYCGALDWNSDTPHANATLIGRDGEAVCVHAPLLRARCPRVADLFELSSSSLSSSATASSSTSSSSSSSSQNGSGDGDGVSITMSQVSGKTLRHLAHFIYTDTLPRFAHNGNSDSGGGSSGGGNGDARTCDHGDNLSQVIDLMAAARDLCPLWEQASPGSANVYLQAGAPAMRRLQALCEAFVAKHMSVHTVCNVLARSLDVDCSFLQQLCYELLVKQKPASDPMFAQKLVSSLSAHPSALAIAFTVTTTGRFQATQPSEPLSIPDPCLLADLEALWLKAAAASSAPGGSGDDGDGGSASSSSWFSSSSPSSSSPSSVSPPSCNAEPDCQVAVVSGGQSVKAHRFVLASRSDYFRAALGNSDFAEAGSATVKLNFPEPVPSHKALCALLRFMYTGTLKDQPLSPEDALDLLHMTGVSDDDGGYFSLGDNNRLRKEARDVVMKEVKASTLLPLLRRATAVGQDQVRSMILQLLVDNGRTPLGRKGFVESLTNEEAPYCVWWTPVQEVELKNELLHHSWALLGSVMERKHDGGGSGGSGGNANGASGGGAGRNKSGKGTKKSKNGSPSGNGVVSSSGGSSGGILTGTPTSAPGGVVGGSLASASGPNARAETTRPSSGSSQSAESAADGGGVSGV